MRVYHILLFYFANLFCLTHSMEKGGYAIAKKIRWSKEHTSGHNILAYSPDLVRPYIAVGSSDRTVSLFDEDGRLHLRCPQADVPSSMAFSSKGSKLAFGSLRDIASGELSVKLFDIASRVADHRVIIKDQPLACGITEVSYDDALELGTAVTHDGLACVWSPQSPSAIEAIKIPHGVASARLLPDCTMQLISRTGLLYTKALQQGAVIHISDLKKLVGSNYKALVGNVVLSPSGKRCLAAFMALSATAQEAINLYACNIPEWKCLAIKSMHGIAAGAFSHDEMTSAVVHDNILNIVKGVPGTEDQEGERLFVESNQRCSAISTSLACSPDGSKLCISSAPHTTTLIDLAIDREDTDSAQ